MKWIVRFILLNIFISSSYATSISSNPAAVNYTPGTGALQQYLEKKRGIKSTGIYFDGSWVADANQLFSGGIPYAKRLTLNNLLLLNINADTEKLGGWRGGLFGAEFLQFNGQSVNAQAGVAQGYNSLPAGAPFNRTELFQLWFRQELFDKKLIFRIGKSVPTLEFSNIVRPVPLNNEKISIPAVSGLIYTPVFVNSSMLGIIPGYYNSIYGITLNFVPVKHWYASYGVYNGSLAQGKQTGELVLPEFNGTYLHIGETGFAWLMGKNKMPGNFGAGAWYQNGLVTSGTLSANSAAGFYLFGTQRLWYKNPEVNNSGISSFYQYGINNSNVLPFKRYLGAGLTAFGLFPKRIDDSLGAGVAFSWLNQKTFPRATELMYQAYYQAKLMKVVYLEPVISYIPTPAAGTSAALAGTIRMIVLF